VPLFEVKLLLRQLGVACVLELADSLHLENSFDDLGLLLGINLEVLDQVDALLRDIFIWVLENRENEVNELSIVANDVARAFFFQHLSSLPFHGDLFYIVLTDLLSVHFCREVALGSLYRQLTHLGIKLVACLPHEFLESTIGIDLNFSLKPFSV